MTMLVSGWVALDDIETPFEKNNVIDNAVTVAERARRRMAPRSVT